MARDAEVHAVLLYGLRPAMAAAAFGRWLLLAGQARNGQPDATHHDRRIHLRISATLIGRTDRHARGHFGRRRGREERRLLRWRGFLTGQAERHARPFTGRRLGQPLRRGRIGNSGCAYLDVRQRRRSVGLRRGLQRPGTRAERERPAATTPTSTRRPVRDPVIRPMASPLGLGFGASARLRPARLPELSVPRGGG